MSKKKLVFITFIFVFFVLVVLFSPLLRVKKVEIEEIGKRNINFDMKKFDIDENFLMFKATDFEKDVINTGLVASIQTERKFFCKLVFKIKWKNPIISVKSGSSNIVLSEDGYVLYINNEDSKLCSIDGLVVKSARIGEPIVTKSNYILENAVNLYLLILENQDLFAKPIKPNICISSDNIIQKINSNYEINFGDGSQTMEKFSKAISIYNSLCEKEVTSGVINVSRKNHYVYETWKNR